MIRRIGSLNIGLLSRKVAMPSSTLFRAMSTEEKEDKKKDKKKDKKGYAQSDAEKERDQMQEGFLLFMEAHDKAKKHKVVWDEETQAEHHRIGREYQRQCFKRHSERVREITDGIWFQKAAIMALPEDLRAKALIVDPTLPPHRDNLYYTPPIKGFDASKYEEEAVKDDMEG